MDNIFTTSAYKDCEEKEKSKTIYKNKMYKINNDWYLYNGRLVYFLSKSIKKIDNKLEIVDLIGDLWTDIYWNNVQNEEGNDFKQGKKPEKLIERIIKSSTNDNDIVLDFFSGSGTTSAVAHKMSKKYIGVEQAEYFNSTIIPRMKKVIYGEQGGISKTVNWQGGGIFKYYQLEQYENVLSKMNYSDELNDGIYIFDKKFSKIIDIEEDKEKININLDTLYKNIDIAETFSNILGLKIIKEDLNSFTLENNITYSKTPETEQEKIEFLRVIKPYIWW